MTTRGPARVVLSLKGSQLALPGSRINSTPNFPSPPALPDAIGRARARLAHRALGLKHAAVDPAIVGRRERGDEAGASPQFSIC